LKRLRKAISFIMVLSIIITGMPFKYDGTHVYAEDSPTVTMSVDYFSGSDTATVTAAVYNEDTPIEGIKVNFSTSFGILDSASEITDTSGQASVTLSSDVSGTARVISNTEDSGYAYEGGSSIEVTFDVSAENPDLRGDYDYLAPDLILAGNDYRYEFSTYWDITNNLTLPLLGPNGSTISWMSDNETVLSVVSDPVDNDYCIGEITRPPYSQGGDSANLTAVISNGDKNAARTFPLYIDCIDPTPDEQKVNDDYNWLGESVLTRGDSIINFSDLKKEKALYLPTVGVNGSSIGWESSNETFLAVKADPDPEMDNLIGEVMLYPTAAQGDQVIALKAAITSGTVTQEKVFNLTIRAVATDSERVAMDEAWLTDSLVLGNNSADDVKADLYLHTEGPSGSSIEWGSSDNSVLYFVKVDGTYPYYIDYYIGRVKRPADSDVSVTLTATIRSGEAVSYKSFDFEIRKIENTFLAAVFDDFSSADNSLLLNGDVSIEDTTNVIRFISNGNGGSVFTKNKIHLEEDMSFSTAFTFSVDDCVDSPGFITGDGGFTFTLQGDDNTKYGTGSETFGAAGIEPSISIGFMTSYFSEQGGTHGTYTGVKVLTNGAEYCSRDISFPVDGTPHFAWIEYDGTEKEMEIRMAGDSERPAEPSGTITGIDLKDIFKDEGTNVIRDLYAGFTGSAGNAGNGTIREIDKVWEWYFKNDSSPIDYDLYNFIDASCISLSADPAGGQPYSTVTAAVYGKYGPVAGIPVEFSTSFGSLDASSVTTDWEGIASVVLSAAADGTAYVKAAASGGAMDSISVNLAVSDEGIVELDKIWLTDERVLNGNSALDNITKDLYLPTIGNNGCNISWTSGNENFVKPDGKVTRPTIGQGEQPVTLTAEISKYSEITGETVKAEKTFDIIVIVRDSDIAAEDRDWLTSDLMLEDNTALDCITGDIWLPLEGYYGSEISWASGNEGVVKPEMTGEGDCIGKVKRPAYTNGDKTVTLTATIRRYTAEVHKEFELTVKATDATDGEAVYAAYSWLTDTIILNGNSSLGSITKNLILPSEGPEGTSILWRSTNDNIAAPDGGIKRPSIEEGSQPVTLTAEISRGSAQLERRFDIWVLAEATDAEAAALDHKWLTEKLILDQNTDKNSVTGNLKLHILGPMGSAISWTSSDPNLVAADGKVSRPSWTQGRKGVALTAVICNGGTALQKTFNLTVLPSEPTDEEAVEADTQRLSALHTLGQNWSQYSITKNLSLPGTLYHGTSITWTSDKPELISDEGIVTRPEYMEGNKWVTLTAVLSKGGKNASKSLDYVVLQKPDIDAPQITETIPINNSMNVLWDTRELKVTFDEDIKRGTLQEIAESNTLGVELHGLGIQQISVRISGKSLIITPIKYLDAGLNELIIPEGTVTDMSGNPMEEFRLSFNVEQKQVNKIEIVSFTPQDMEKNVPLRPSISFSYNYSDIEWGSSFRDISIRSKAGRAIPFSASLNGNKVTLDLRETMEPATIYEISVPAGAVRDRFENVSIGKLIQFRTAADNKGPEITGTYPLEGQTGVDIHEAIEVSFNGIVKAKDSGLMLVDDKGIQVKTYVRSLNAEEKGLILEPYVPLEPNIQYTVTGPYDSASNPSGLEFFSMSFTTGANALGKLRVFPVSIADSVGAPIHKPIEIEFADTVIKGPEFEDITVLDSEGNMVSFTAEEKGGKASLIPVSALKPSETYTVNIPAGAYKNTAGGINDSFKFSFTTARKLEPGSFAVNPSAVWLVGRPMEFSAAGIQNTFRQSGYEITSFDWDLGNGYTSKESSVSYTYNTEGEYEVVLNLKDNKGFSYELKQTVIIEGMDSKNITMSISHPESDYLYITSSTVSMENRLYKLYLKCNGGFVSGETIRVKLYKNGALQRDFGTITAGSTDNEYAFPFYYKGYGYLGTYELVFECESLPGGKVIREPVIIDETGGMGTMKIKLYDLDTQGYYEEPDTLRIIVNGKQKVAAKDWYNANEGYCYFIPQVEINAKCTLRINGWTLDKEEFTHRGSSYTTVLVGRKIKPGVNSVDYEFADENTFTFIEGVSTGQLSFKVEGDWNGLEPGYYEMRTDSGSFSITSVESRIKFDPGKELLAGDDLAVRMVARNGSVSPWRYISVKVIPEPYLNFGIKLNTRFEDGEYKISLPMIGLGNVLGGKIDMLEDIPMLDKADSFGINLTNMVAEGTMDEDGWVIFNLSGGGGFKEIKKKASGKSSKTVKVTSVGYEVSAEVAVELYLYYDEKAGEWKTLAGVFDVMGYGGRSWSKGYEIPVIHLGADATLELGSYVGGTLIIDKRPDSKREYSGIISIAPTIAVELELDSKVYSIACGIYGDVPAEVHIPTGYVEAEVNITAKIRARCLAWTKTVFEKKLVGEHWDNGKEKVELKLVSSSGQPIMEALYNKDEGFVITPRDYLDRGTSWQGQGNEAEVRLMKTASISKSEASGNEDSQSKVMKDNIYPDSTVQLVSAGEGLWMIWTDDNPERSAVNRTQMMYSVLENGVWSEPMWMDQDGTADFEPSAAAAGEGILMAWLDIRQSMEDDTDMDSFAENAEISVTEGVYKAGADDMQLVMLTEEEGKFDHSPMLAADDDKGLLVWTRSEGLGVNFGNGEETESLEKGDCLIYSSWDGSGWKEPEVIEDNLPVVLNSFVEMNGDEGLLLYTLDMDNNQATESDREIFARTFDGGSWGEAVQITDNQLSDSGPGAVFCNGDWFITWYQNGRIMYKEGLGEESRTADALNAVEGDYRIALSKRDRPQIALVYRNNGESGARGLSASFYDIENSTWSEEIQLTGGNEFVSSFSPAFTEDGKLDIAYTRSEIVTEVIDGAESKNISDKVDLYMLTYTPVHDLELDDGAGISLSPEIPLPGTLETVTVTVRNQGDFAENAKLRLYDGDPLKGGKEIAEAFSEKPIPARSSVEMNIEWLVAQGEKGEYDFYVVVLPDAGVLETNDKNNTLNHKVSVADIAITDLKCSNIAKDDYLITATIANRGGIELSGIKLRLDQVPSGNIIETRELDMLRPGEEETINMIISSGGINAVLRVLLPEGVTESVEDNNKYEFVLEPASIVVEGASPSDGEVKVGIQKPLTISFNMSVEAGNGFEEIMLMDDEFNSIDIEKTLEGSTLTLTSLSPLAYGTQHTLVIPAGAVGDDYGHTMEGSYSMSFTTTASSPEVIFAYPGNGMSDTALDTEIRIQFNQSVLSGPKYGEIAIYGPASEKLTSSLSIEGEWMNIRPAAELEGEKQYKLTIPKGAVANERSEAQQEDYILEFTTAKADDNVDGEDDDDNDRDSRQEQQVYQPTVKISRQTSADGSSTATIDVDGQTISGLRSDGAAAVLDVTNEVKDDDTIRIDLFGDALKQLAENKRGLSIVTGKGDIYIPAELVASFLGKVGNSISITIAENDEGAGDEGRVSSGVYDFTITAGDRPVTEFVSQLIVTIPLDGSKIGSAKRVIACVYDEESGSWQPVGGVTDEMKGTVTFGTRHFSTYAAFEKEMHFDDVTSSWSKEKVEILASRRLINGVSDTAYNPEGSITRAEFAALLVRSLYGRLSKSKGTFTDVSAGSWYADLVETAYELGLVNGIGEDSFGPDVKINREQLAVMVYRLYQYKKDTNKVNSFNTTFGDYKDISSYAKDAAGFAAKAGIMTGSGGRFEPKRSATRQEAAVVLYRLLEYMGEL